VRPGVVRPTKPQKFLSENIRSRFTVFYGIRHDFLYTLCSVGSNVYGKSSTLSENTCFPTGTACGPPQCSQAFDIDKVRGVLGRVRVLVSKIQALLRTTEFSAVPAYNPNLWFFYF
jgi:hypothetical protein